MTATTGSILVEMKKNSTSLTFSTGRIDSAYAAGTPSSSTSSVDTPVAMAELATYVPLPPSITARNWSSVGAKNHVGGSDPGWFSCLNAVAAIQATGKKNDRASSQVSVVSTPPVARPRAGRSEVRVSADMLTP